MNNDLSTPPPRRYAVTKRTSEGHTYLSFCDEDLLAEQIQRAKMLNDTIISIVLL